MGFKAFGKGMICRGKQYAENTTYEESGAKSCCNPGIMHYCEEPFDVWDYYPVVDENGDFSEYAEVEPLDKVLAEGNKRATKKLHIGAKLSLKDFIKAEIDFVRESTGYYSKQAATGNSSTQAATGYYSTQAATGYYSKQAATGDSSTQAATGNYSTQAATGNYSKQAATGNYSTQAATGNYSTQAATGKHCVSAIIGNAGRIKSTMGSWIVLAEWKDTEKGYIPVCVKSAQIDGETLKPDTWYTLKNGEFVEASDDD